LFYDAKQDVPKSSTNFNHRKVVGYYNVNVKNITTDFFDRELGHGLKKKKKKIKKKLKKKKKKF
jgi:hypothetical protein